jgi:MoaA/NifB/PqqE/SkfB family radical SAM enzyme
MSDKIPDTFCTHKWQEIFVNFEQSFSYSCCKGTPKQFTDDIFENIHQEQQNLLNGIQDESCNYCWGVENVGGESLRNSYLKQFDKNEFKKIINSPPSRVQVNLGNTCNFQCLYCNPKFSSRWEQDVLKQPYKIFSDRFFYQTGIKNTSAIDLTRKFLKNVGHLEYITISGGEPTYNKNLLEIVNLVSADSIEITTNLSASIDDLLTLLEKLKKFNKVILNVSIDATDEVAEFVRYGLDFNKFNENLNFLLDNKPDNVLVRVLTLFTSLTILDIDNFSKYINDKLDKIDIWFLWYCVDPKIQSFSTLPEKHKSAIKKQLEKLKNSDKIRNIDSVLSALNTFTFNNTLYQQLKVFLNEFSYRKQIEIPELLKEFRN